VYVYEFSDRSAYIGLTYNIYKRHEQHLKDNKSQVCKKIKENRDIKYELKKIIEIVEVEKAQYYENFYVEKYKKEKWEVLNKIKAGGIGSVNKKWNKEICKNEALKYNYRREFKLNNRQAYNASVRNKWLDEVCSHMLPPIRKPDYYWTKERCMEVALKYKNRGEFEHSIDGSAHRVALKKGWLNEICSHMIFLHRPDGYWTKERCKEEASKYLKRNDFKKNSYSAYQAASKQKILDDICSHMKILRKIKTG
jgi:predicted GIY-YIG superfamily endonuclease